MHAARYRKKPVVIEAIQFGLAEYGDEAMPFRGPVPTWLSDALSEGKIVPEFRGEDYWYLRIDTLEGAMYASPDDWIIKGVQNEIYPCKPAIFEATYEAVA
jgi:hypothetical protein